MAHSGDAFKSKVPCCPLPLVGDDFHPPVSVAGLGVRGPLGPRGGISSGNFPGSSLGCAGAPGSRTGGGTSGLGLPGGTPGGGSVGVPGVAGGISGGSIGMKIPADYPEATTRKPVRCSQVGTENRRRLSRGRAACCCASCPRSHSRARPCRRCSRPATRLSTDARSRPRAATMPAALP